MEVESAEDSDFSSDESTDSSSPEKPSFMSRVTCSEGGINQVMPWIAASHQVLLTNSAM